MRSEFAFLFPAMPKTKKARKPAIKAISVGASVVLSLDGKTYTVAERDTRYKNAWFVVNADGVRAPYSFSRDMLKVI
ncbi:hypothetical protein EOA32_00750 [Mesorhizobium sp. M1A.F.Ca.ET.072.01.1.1]|uniref:hypothetical protein n=1 Tax=Mesorhizobium sp. M1A.F.Ca.ET.072.01.1.1 TaxID=2496753 RepID=UPI000FD600B0|nr:hypothetical protein [Mesorhizobium sp. M1A.F.Ca.ET.072.01.1.1]RUW55580.1 hypothetical protein EOA32_00750 [Mesorhizobium sp. M1A.F.Ca.ET.072.01.1.1]